MNGRALAGHPCWSWLAADLSRLQPRVMVTLGAVVGQALSLTSGIQHWPADWEVMVPSRL